MHDGLTNFTMHVMEISWQMYTIASTLWTQLLVLTLLDH